MTSLTVYEMHDVALRGKVLLGLVCKFGATEEQAEVCWKQCSFVPGYSLVSHVLESGRYLLTIPRNNNHLLKLLLFSGE